MAKAGSGVFKDWEALHQQWWNAVSDGAGKFVHGDWRDGAKAFGAIDPPLLAAVMASIAHDDDRPGSFPRGSAGLVTLLFQVRKLAESLVPHEAPPMLRADVAALTERWVADQTLTWIGLARLTTMAEGDMFRLFARTIEFLSQLKTLKATHPSLAESADRAIAGMRRGVLEELP